jgi:hypothetical protein
VARQPVGVPGGDVASRPADPLRWRHCAGTCRRRRQRDVRVTPDGRRSVETVYALTSRDHRAADPNLIAAWLRGHWQIENRVHHVRDVTQREDASRIRTGNGPQVMAALRNTATNIARLAGHDNIAAAQRAAAWHPTAITDALDAA